MWGSNEDGPTYTLKGSRRQRDIRANSERYQPFRRRTDHQLWDVQTLQEMKQYATETPLNSACITPLRPYIVLGGGQDAMNVTTTSQRAGKFESRFWHKLFEEEVGRVRGHL